MEFLSPAEIYVATRQVVHLQGIQPGIASGLARQHRPAAIGAGGVPSSTPPEDKLLFVSCFDNVALK